MRGKVSVSQLERRAWVYVRQSTPTQVLQHGESTKRQYALADRAVGLGWPREAVEVVDEDLGRSGSTTEGRTGFARLAEAVARGEAGAVLAVEVSRLARSSEDWQRLLALCAVAEVAVIDEQAIYDPGDRDDKLLLDIKGTMSEAELHWIRLRLIGGMQSKARRGELRIPAPTGYVWNGRRLEFDPDEAVRRAVQAVFDRYEVEPSVWAVLRWAQTSGLSMPVRRCHADGTTEVLWKPLALSRLHTMVKNPIYAGVYAYGRRPERKVIVDGRIRRVRADGRDPERWAVRIENAHPGYIGWETYLKNQEKLRDNFARFGPPHRGAPREGPALLPGLLLCGRCGLRMHVSYGGGAKRRWCYHCRGDRDHGNKTCWTITGRPLDTAVERAFLETMVPEELELSLAVEHEAGVQAEALDRQWRARLEQADYEARRAERRYKAVDPDNRVVARTLEREWEERLRELEDVERHFAEAKRARHVELTEEDRSRVRELARDLPAVWRAPTTLQADRKAMLRLAITAVAATPVEVPHRATRLRIEWKSGAVTELEVPRPHRREILRTPKEAMVRIRELALEGLRDEEIATRLNAERLRTGHDRTWAACAVKWARRRGAIPRVAPDALRCPPLPDRHPDGRYSVPGAARRFDVSTGVVHGWIVRHLVRAAREPFGRYPQVWWLHIDDSTGTRLAAIAKRHSEAQATAMPNPTDGTS
jgi:DNA invertase Pin-like site-specific DNA recombinase/uncharacterized protein YndB with AHSA1/START domain